MRYVVNILAHLRRNLVIRLTLEMMMLRIRHGRARMLFGSLIGKSKILFPPGPKKIPKRPLRVDDAPPIIILCVYRI